jgi:squalene cyclase
VFTEGQKRSLERIAADIVKKQREDGSWEFFLSRPPVNESQATDAAWIVMALQGEAGSEAESTRTAVGKGIAWLSGAEPENDQAKVLKLLVALRAGKPRGELQPSIDALFAAQRGDGGWGQTAGAASDAFATGQAVYVLALAGYTAEQPGIKRAMDFLVATQKSDGSWPMSSRATPDGKPGSAKLLTPITCAASAWATLGLARLAPNRP